MMIAMKWGWVIGVINGALTTTAIAAADGLEDPAVNHETRASVAPSAPPAQPPAPRLWYGWQTLALDGTLLVGSVVLLHLGSDTNSDVIDTLAWTPAIAFVTGGPAIHLFHGEPWRALGSFGLRLGLPVVGGAVGVGLFASCSGTRSDGNCGLGQIVGGFAAGVLAASLIDGLLVARESARPSGVALSLAPFISADGSTRELRLRGQF
jgi:hypothetical protein